MAGTVSNLGLGSSVLTQDMLDQLKEVDEKSRVKPYETKMESNTTKLTALTELTTKLSTLRSSVNSLGDTTAFAKRKVTASVTGDTAAATMTVSNGVSVQNMSISVEQIAQKDVYQSKGLTSNTDRVLDSNQNAATFTISHGSKQYAIQVDSTTTYSDLADKINSVTDGAIIAKVVNTGESGTPYRFTLSSKEMGSENSIRFFAGTTDTNGILQENADAQKVLEKLGWGSLQTTNIDSVSGFTFSGGTKTSAITNLANETLTKDVKFTLFAGTEEFKIEVAVGSSYQYLIDKVKDVTGDKINLKANQGTNGYIFNFSTGSNASSSTTIKVFNGVKDDSTGKYNVDSSTTNFIEDTLKITLNKAYAVDDASGDYHLKKAQDAIFTVDGVKMWRNSNSVTDITTGITLNILKAGDVNFDIAQDTSGISDTMQEIADNFNELVNYLSTATAYDSDSGSTGDLSGVAEVKNIKTNLLDMLFKTKTVTGKSTDSSGNTTTTNVYLSVIDYGLSLNESGLLTFNSTTFESKLKESAEQAESFFAGTTGFEELKINTVATNFDDTSLDNLSFKNSDFKIKFNGETYDLSKNKDGTDFVLTGTTGKERAQQLLDHLNSFGITDLKIKLTSYSMKDSSGNTVTGYSFSFNSDNGSDFYLEGDSTFLQKLGFSATNFSPETETSTGIFSELGSTIKGMINTSSSDTLKGSLTLLSERLTAKNTSLKEEKEKEQSRIDSYYETMAAKWTQYDQIIANLKTQANTITQMINAANGNNSSSSS